jgi:hypothetical protein
MADEQPGGSGGGKRAADKKPGVGSVAEPIVLIALAVIVGTCSGSLTGGRFGASSFKKSMEKLDPVQEGRRKALEATMEGEQRLRSAYDEGLARGKARKLEELEEEIGKLGREDKDIWNTTIEDNAIASCTSYYMKGINDGEKAYESAFRWEYQVPRCSRGVVKSRLTERVQLYHGNIPVGNAYEREISEEMWGNCFAMSKHYLETLEGIKKINFNQDLDWAVEKKEIEVPKEP